ncbi:MAG: exodeoxyribonuclease V subunit gamma [Gammaproteobacteria bacterium]|nr:exodeoxyribonuclease V subunit gamma [Gammaproteobacteria bacterium]
MLNVVHCPKLEQLAAHWLVQRADDQRDVFQPEVVIVGHEAMGDWLRQFVSVADGIAANLKFELPAAAIWRHMRLINANLPDKTRLDKTELRLRLFNLLDEPNQPKRWRRADVLADVFDQYLIYRTDLLSAWERGEQQGFWQADLWRKLQASAPTEHQRHRLLARCIERLEQGPPIALPPLRLFNVLGLAPEYLRFFVALSEHTTVQWYVADPSSDYWQDRDQQSNPLLSSLAKSLRDQLNLMAQSGEIEHHYIAAADNPKSQLGALQDSIIANQMPPAHADDQSITFTNCHTRVRELETLCDFIQDQLTADTSLALSDIIVMAPDINRYAPYIGAVFERGAAPLAVNIADRDVTQAVPNIERWLGVIDHSQSPLSLDEFLDLLREPAVLTQLGLTLAAIDRFASLLNQWHVKTLDSALDSTSAGNLGHFLTQATLSHLSGAQVPLIADRFSKIALLDEDFGLLKAIYPLVKRFDKITARRDTSKTLSEWIGVVNQDWQVLFGSQESVIAEREILDGALEKLIEQHQQADCDSVAFDYAILIEQIREVLKHTKFGRHFLTGSLTFCSLLPMRSIPHKVVCIIGLNDGEFPSNPAQQSFDLISALPRLGDRNRRDDQRQLFLEALMSCRQRLYLSYIGKDPSSNEPKPPSLVIEQLRSALHQTTAAIEVSLHSFDPDKGRRWPYYCIAQRKESLEYNQDDIKTASGSLSGMLAYYRHPSRAYLRDHHIERHWRQRPLSLDPLDKLNKWQRSNAVSRLKALKAEPWKTAAIRSGLFGHGATADTEAAAAEISLQTLGFDFAAHSECCHVNVELNDTRHSLQFNTSKSAQIALLIDAPPKECVHRWFEAMLKQLIANSQGIDVTLALTNLQSASVWHSEVLEASAANAWLQRLYRVYETGIRSPLPIFAKTSPLLCLTTEAKANDAWVGGQDSAGESEHPEHRLLFAQPLQSIDRVKDLAEEIYGPLREMLK